MDIQEAIQTLSTSQGLESPATSTALSAITSFVGQESSLASPHLRAAALAVLQFVKNNSATLRQQPEDELSLLTAALKALIPLIECTPWPFVQRAMISKQLPLALRGLTHYHASDPSLSLRSLVVQAYLRILESGASSSYHTSEIRIATDGVISLLAGSDAELTKSTTQRLLDTYLTSNGSNGGSLFAALMAAAATSSEPVPLLAVEEAILDESRFTEEQRQKFLQVMPASYAGKGTAASKKALGEIKEAPLLTDTAEDIAQSLKVLGSLLTEDRTALVNEATGKEILTESFFTESIPRRRASSCNALLGRRGRLSGRANCRGAFAVLAAEPQRGCSAGNRAVGGLHHDK